MDDWSHALVVPKAEASSVTKMAGVRDRLAKIPNPGLLLRGSELQASATLCHAGPNPRKRRSMLSLIF